MIDVQTTDAVATLRIVGRFDFRCVKEFHAALGSTRPSWVVDMRDVDYVDSAALGLLLLLRERAGGDRASVTIQNLGGQPRDVFLMSKFDRMFTLV